MILSNSVIKKLEQIRVDFGFREDVDRHDIALRTINFINDRRREILNFPRRIEVKAQLEKYVGLARDLLATIKALPTETQEKYNIHFSLMRNNATYSKYLKIQDLHNAIKAFSDMGPYIYPNNTESTNGAIALKIEIATQAYRLLSCFEKGAVDIYIKIDTILRNKKIFVHEAKLTDYLAKSLEELIGACKFVISRIRKDGRPSEALTPEVIIWLAYVYENYGINQKRKAKTYYHQDHENDTWYYRGEFFEFILACKGILKILNVPLPSEISSIGELVQRSLKQYRIIVGRKAIKILNNRATLEVAHLTHLMDIEDLTVWF